MFRCGTAWEPCAGLVHRRLHGLQPQLGGGYRRRDAARRIPDQLAAGRNAEQRDSGRGAPEPVYGVPAGRHLGRLFCRLAVVGDVVLVLQPVAGLAGQDVPGRHSERLFELAGTSGRHERRSDSRRGQDREVRGLPAHHGRLRADPLQPDRHRRQGDGAAGYAEGGLYEDLRGAGRGGRHADGAPRDVDLGRSRQGLRRGSGQMDQVCQFAEVAHGDPSGLRRPDDGGAACPGGDRHLGRQAGRHGDERRQRLPFGDQHQPLLQGGLRVQRR